MKVKEKSPSVSREDSHVKPETDVVFEGVGVHAKVGLAWVHRTAVASV